ASVGSKIVLPLDVAEDRQIDELVAELDKALGGLDVLVHSIGFAPREQLAGKYLDAVTREGFRIAHDISSYSFAALGKAVRPLMRGRAGSMLTLTYLGAVRAVPMYNVMGPAKASLEANVRFMAAELGEEGIRVNGISAGPIKTLAAAGITGFRSMLSMAEKAAPLKRNVTIEEVGNAAAFLSSDLASGITGEILYVDAGYNIVGMNFGE
ncbi:MAG: enoyl-ACP reductase, partial [Gammaproteobacteria bacterium]